MDIGKENLTYTNTAQRQSLAQTIKFPKFRYCKNENLAGLPFDFISEEIFLLRSLGQCRVNFCAETL